jgi:hypothetical protein
MSTLIQLHTRTNEDGFCSCSATKLQSTSTLNDKLVSPSLSINNFKFTDTACHFKQDKKHKNNIFCYRYRGHKKIRLSFYVQIVRSLYSFTSNPNIIIYYCRCHQVTDSQKYLLCIHYKQRTMASLLQNWVNRFN